MYQPIYTNTVYSFSKYFNVYFRCFHEHLDLFTEIKNPDVKSLIETPFGGRYCGKIPPRPRISMYKVSVCRKLFPILPLSINIPLRPHLISKCIIVYRKFPSRCSLLYSLPTEKISPYQDFLELSRLSRTSRTSLVPSILPPDMTPCATS